MLENIELYQDIKEKIDNCISNDKNVIYVIKGFDSFSFRDDYRVEKLYSADFSKLKDFDLKSQLPDVLQRLASQDSYVLSMEEYLLGQGVLSAMYKLYKYRITVIENDLFRHYYPVPSSVDGEALANRIEGEEDEYDIFYDEFLEINGHLFVTFKPVESDVEVSYVSPFSKTHAPKEAMPGTAKDISFGNSDETMIQALCEILEGSEKNYRILKEKYETSYIDRIVSILSDYGYRFSVVQKEISFEAPENYEEYEEILKRKNKIYTFRDIVFYSSPGNGLDTIRVNQSVIIDRLVQNALKANKNDNYNDIFVTAPTGSGKSVLFQIPSIYLGEKYDLFTIIVSPLIGLMEDQISNIKDMSDAAATINSDYTPQEKETIKEKIKNHEIDILYVSPETLLSNSDITSLIADREIGLLVVDEAHIVSTWGKSFRPDYWFLGDYISSLRKRGKYRFPIATFSATITYGGDDDMHGDIIESLKMRTGSNEFIAPMRRDDISFDIEVIEKKNDYQKEKNEKVQEDLDQLIENRIKTIVYFPYARQVREPRLYVNDMSKAAQYYGGMDKFLKKSETEDFKSSKKTMMLATKAFGMGIDINDIETVYHYAPTGNLCDYVQEIGRAARREDIHGTAKLSYFKEDFRYIKQLYGMSAIRDYHIISVLKKIRDLYLEKEKRNFVVSSDEFAYIFPSAQSSDDVDTKLKTVLLMIQKDFENDSRINFKPLVFRPRSMFTLGYLMIKDQDLHELRSKYGRFMKYFKLYSTASSMESKFTVNKKYLGEVKNHETGTREVYDSSVENSISYLGDVYKVDFKSLWEDHYNDISFGMFKRQFYNGELDGFPLTKEFLPEYLLNVDTRLETIGDSCERMISYLDEILVKLMELPLDDKHISIEEVSSIISSLDNTGLNSSECTIAAENIIQIINRFSFGKNFFNQLVFKQHADTHKYSVSSSNQISTRIRSMQKTLRSQFSRSWHRQNRVFLINTKSKKVSESQEMLLAQLLETFKLASYDVVSGDVPEYFIRVNSVTSIERILNEKNYHSKMVDLVQNRHIKSIEDMTYFFTVLSEDKERWDYIEKYFAGVE